MVVDFQGLANWVQVLIETSIAGIRKTLIQPTSSASAPSTFMRVPLIIARSRRSLGLVWGMLMVLPGRSSSPSIMIVDGAFVVIINIIIAIWCGKLSTGIRRLLTFFHELDNTEKLSYKPSWSMSFGQGLCDKTLSEGKFVCDLKQWSD